ncbi:hypothetical protein EI77_00590 [Prosthecobacter fusiformis]|uniref:DUF4064 domain-containing protein n=1 Tax=Prosthecobacter fusiformis TaxID=48464 RepID=A0A4R7SST6_9BACT|nr:hypothetical protein [Prosthecobacter fusiformis]TDU81287.1 hypothetical protein EI77_00590 [Prosthecobacter fusiformis]
MTQPVSQRGALLAKIGALLQVAQLIGLAATLATMNAAAGNFNIQPTATDATVAEVAKASTVMSNATHYLFFGTGIAVIGMIMVIVAATVYRYRANWFFWFLCVYGGAMTISYMFPFGLFFLIYALTKRKEFDLDPGPQPGTLVR